MSSRLFRLSVLTLCILVSSSLIAWSQDNQVALEKATTTSTSPTGLESRFPVSYSLAVQEATNFSPVSDSQIEERQRKLLQSLRSLDSFFSINPSWRRFLDYDTLLQSSERISPSNEELLVSPSLLKSWWVATDSLDVPQIYQTERLIRERDAMARQRVVSETSLTRRQRLDGLDQSWKEFTSIPTMEKRVVLIKNLHEMEAMGQAKPLINEIRSFCILPNLLIQTHRKGLITNDTKPINDTFSTSGLYGRMQMNGTGSLTGTQSSRVIPNAVAAEYEIDLNGTSRVTSRGAISEVSIQSTSTASVFAAKRVAFSGWGRWSLGASVASAPTTIQYDSIAPSTRGRARQRTISEVQASKLSSESQAQRETENSLKSRLDQEVEVFIQQIDTRPLLQLRDILVNTSSDLLTINHSSTSEGIEVAIRCYDRSFPLFAESAPPQVSAEGTIASIHDSLLQLILQSKLMNSQLGFAVQPPGKVEGQDADSPIGLVGERVRLVFHPQSSIQTACHDTGLKTIVRLKSITDGETTMRDCRLEIEWDLTPTQTGLRMTRRENMRVLPIDFHPERDRLSVRQVSAYRALERTLAESIDLEQILELPSAIGSNVTPDNLQIHVGSGWLQFVSNP